MIRTALVGCGRWGKVLLKSALKVGEFEFVALVDPNQENRCAAFSHLPKPDVAAFESVDELVDGGPKADLIMIATPASTHAGLVPKFLEMGFDVFCEKPLCFNGDELKKIESVLKPDQILQVGYEYVYVPELRSFGFRSMTEFRTFWCNHGPVREDVGGLLNTLIHPASVLASFVLCTEFDVHVHIGAMSYLGQAHPGCVTVVGDIEFHNGAFDYDHLHYVLSTTWSAHRKVRRIEIVTQNRDVVYDEVGHVTHEWVSPATHIADEIMSGSSIESELLVLADAIDTREQMYLEPCLTETTMRLLGVI